MNVHRRKDGAITRFDLVTREHKNVIQRDIRSCFLTEFDYLKLTNPSYECVLENRKEEDAKEAEIPIPMNVGLHTVLTDPEPKMKKRGTERMFSTLTYVPNLKKTAKRN